MDIYLYGMTVLSTIHLLAGVYPEADSYGEISETYIIPGGETGNSAIILANLGYSVKIDGPFLGTKTIEGIMDFYNDRGIDCSRLHFDSTFDGVQDLVLIDRSSRTVFGRFGGYFSEGRRWNRPSEEDISAAKIVSLDPFFKEESVQVAGFCAQINKRYVTIDCPYQGVIHKNATATVISKEYIRNTYPDEDMEALFRKYTDNSKGLVIFTFGSEEIFYGRKGGNINRMRPYKVEVKSTLGAGDTFRAGVV
ncbi:MAG: PfkB family carbohydrate kinase, partial [Bacillota bacterium]|nr:PfkB family carbohydrate kinase [Bacillota bacterium]